ncbi:hypothetical protein D3C73_975640 [compost metagenome]
MADLAGNGEGHRNPMIAVAFNGATAQRYAAVQGGAIFGLVHLHAQRAQAGRHRRQTIGFLHPQFGGAGHHSLPFSGGSGHEQGREFVDHVRHQFLRNARALQRRVAHHQIGHRLATLLCRVLFGDVRPHQAQRVQQAGTARIEADLLQAQLGAGNDAGRDQEERSRGEVGRHHDVGRAQALATAQAGLARRERDVHAERGQHALGVVTGRVRLGHAGLAMRVQARQQHGGLDLRAGHGRGKVDAVQRLPAMHVQRWRAVCLGVDLRAHLRQRTGDAAHRTAGQRFVANQRAVECLTGQQAGEQQQRVIDDSEYAVSACFIIHALAPLRKFCSPPACRRPGSR